MTTARQKMKTYMQETLNDQAHLHNWIYLATRPLAVPHSYQHQKIIADCSKGAEYIAYWSGSPDPFGRNYDQYGNSTSACAHLAHLDHPSELQVGDYVTFGLYGHEHMVVVYETGSDPLVWSHGHQGAPNTYRLSYDKRVKQYLHNPIANIIEPSPARLRAKTGFWAWYHWNTGSGHWAKYGERNKTVRPNVPRRIPLLWWKHRARLIMLTRRGRANKSTA